MTNNQKFTFLLGIFLMFAIVFTLFLRRPKQNPNPVPPPKLVEVKTEPDDASIQELSDLLSIEVVP